MPVSPDVSANTLFSTNVEITNLLKYEGRTLWNSLSKYAPEKAETMPNFSPATSHRPTCDWPSGTVGLRPERETSLDSKQSELLVETFRDYIRKREDTAFSEFLPQNDVAEYIPPPLPLPSWGLSHQWNLPMRDDARTISKSTGSAEPAKADNTGTNTRTALGLYISLVV